MGIPFGILMGCAMEVLNGLGHGFHENPYENALLVEFRLRTIQQRVSCKPGNKNGETK